MSSIFSLAKEKVPKGFEEHKLAIGAAVCVTTAAVYLYKTYSELPPSSRTKQLIKFDDQTHGGKIFGQAFHNHGVKFVFTLVGGHISPILVGCEDVGIKVIDVRHEVNAAFAADAVSRLTGTPGVAVVTAGPGVTNTITALKNAQIAQSPLILIGGATSDLLKGMGSLQDVDQLSLVKSLTKWYAHVGSVGEIGPAVEKAFWIAQSGTPGPVFLEVPLDVLYPKTVATETFQSKKAANPSLRDQFANWYMNRHLKHLFGVDTITLHEPLQFSFPEPTSSQLSYAVRLLKSAKKPFLMIGSQALLSTKDVYSGKLVQAVNKLGIPSSLSGMARGLLGKSNKLQIKQKLARKAGLRECDVIIVAGLPLDFRLDYGRSISGRAKLIMVNRDSTDLTKNSILRPATLAAQSDPCAFLIKLAESLGDVSSNWSEWQLHLTSKEQELEKNIDDKKEQKQQLVNPLYLCQEIEKAADDNSIFVADGGDFVGTAAYILRPRGPLSWLDPGPFGTLGVGSAFAMAAKLCRPDSEVWILFGDGAVGFSIAEFDTFVRHKIPIIAIIGNDAAWAQILRDQHKILKSDVACVLEYTNYQDCSIGLGAEGILVKDEKDVPEALQKAKQIAREKKMPVMVNVMINKSDFREGSISV